MLALSPLAVPGALGGGIEGLSTFGATDTMEIGFGRPLKSSAIHVSSGWGKDDRHHTDRHHPAIDMPTPVGTPVLAVANGVVTKVVNDPSGQAGRYIILSHDKGWYSRYLHLSKTMVTVGAPVAKGQTIAKSGNTGNSAGPHLHLDLWLDPELIPRLERDVPRPTTGYPIEMGGRKAVPAEPWIPVDSYGKDVIARDRKQKVPLYWDRHLTEHADPQTMNAWVGIGGVLALVGVGITAVAAVKLVQVLTQARRLRLRSAH